MCPAIARTWFECLQLLAVLLIAVGVCDGVPAGEPPKNRGSQGGADQTPDQNKTGSRLWSFQKPVRPPLPEPPANGSNNPIDAFIHAKLNEQGVSPAPPADRRTLIRRAYFDLIGLPPAPGRVEAFVKDSDPTAWAKAIDELLKSPQYGERWGRHWLDVARYADSGGYETDIYYRNAWRYRDYVVKSFNDDKPYDQFLHEQIAGDELWPDNLDLDPKRVYIVSEGKRRHLEALIGTGFYALGPQIHESGLDARKLRHEQLTDWGDTTGSVFLGLTLGCARCHDHKFEPLTQHDYYAMQAIFSDSIEHDVPLLTAMEVADWRQHYPRIIAVDEARRAYRLFEKKLGGREATPDEQQEKRRLRESIAQAVLQLPEQAASVPNCPYDALMGMPIASVLGHELPELVKPVHRLERGELSQPQEMVEPGLPAALAEATGCDPAIPGTLGSRQQLALWLTRPDHPLTSRVMVNRIWHWHFGRGIVATPNDFGTMGQAPTHPELLDWLATEFVAPSPQPSPPAAGEEGEVRGWSIKNLHRLIMLSSTYQMSSRFSTDEHLARDPDNRYWWRMNRRRLEAKALWDAVHAVAGTLDLTMGGRP